MLPIHPPYRAVHQANGRAGSGRLPGRSVGRLRLLTRLRAPSGDNPLVVRLLDDTPRFRPGIHISLDLLAFRNPAPIKLSSRLRPGLHVGTGRMSEKLLWSLQKGAQTARAELCRVEDDRPRAPLQLVRRTGAQPGVLR